MICNDKRGWLKGVIAFAMTFVLSGHVFAGNDIERIVIFGDSLSDPGNAFILTGEQSVPPYNLIPDAPYAVGGHHFSNGKTWAEVFARKLGEKAKPAFRFKGDSNFAIGGSRARNEGPANLSMQVATYLSMPDDERAESLFVIFIGGNDIRDAIVALATDPSGQTSGLILQQALTSVSDNMLALIQSGAKRFLILNAPDLALTPAVRLQGPQAQFAASLLSAQYNQGLAQIMLGLKAVFPIDVTEFDLHAKLHSLAAGLEHLQFDVVDQACIIPGATEDAVCDNPNRYMFWDGIHPTKIVHRFIGVEAARLFHD